MHTELADDQREAYEKYLLAGDDEAQAQKAMSTLVQGSQAYNYLYFLHKFRTVGYAGLTADDHERLNKYTKKLDNRFSA